MCVNVYEQLCECECSCVSGNELWVYECVTVCAFVCEWDRDCVSDCVCFSGYVHVSVLLCGRAGV